MAILQRAPNTILLAGVQRAAIINDIPAGEAITPGHLVEMYSDGGVLKWRKNASATEFATLAVALDQPEMNKGIDDAYAAGDLVKAAFLLPGDVFWGLISSGQDIAMAELLQTTGDGTVKSATATTADANLARFQSLSAPGAVTTSTRLRVQVIG